MDGNRELMLGNKAVARGLYEAGCAFVSSYPGTPSTEITEEAVKYMGEDIANYFREVLTDQYGWNIRNQVSHGLLASDSFNFGMADRLIHAFLMLGVFKKKEL